MNAPHLGEAFYNLRFRTRLVLVLFLVLAVTSAVLLATYVRENRRIKAYVAGITSDLLAISQLTQEQVPANSTRTQALEAYMQALKGAGLSSITVASPTGEVVASTNPRQVGRRIKIKRRRAARKPNPIEISAEFPEVDVDSAVREKTYFVEFPIVQGDTVIGYARVRGFGDQLDSLLRRSDLARSFWILAVILAGIFALVYLTLLFTKPVDMLAEGAKQVARGNLYVSLPVKGKDEMARLAQTFNQMVERLREAHILQERLNEAEKLSLLGRFAASVAHEVRNSLNFMNLSIDQIRAKQTAVLSAAASTPAGERAAREAQRNLANVKEEINRLNHLVNEFLSAGRQTPPQLRLCGLRETVTQAVTLVEKQARAQEVAIRTGLPADLPEVLADAAQMKTCFVNLLTNAIQAMPGGGLISVSARRTGENGAAEMLELRFADTGPGIPRADREKVFTPFFSTKTTGFGLGLAITKKIVEDHGGRIYIRDGEQPGAVIIIEIPVHGAAAAPGESSLSVPAVSNS
ncbi:MAG: ATP-binding protein [Terriglobia bacterium]